MTKNIYMMVGAAGAGKSTFIKNFFPDAFGVSRDVARFDVMAKYKTDDYFAHEKKRSIPTSTASIVQLSVGGKLLYLMLLT